MGWVTPSGEYIGNGVGAMALLSYLGLIIISQGRLTIIKYNTEYNAMFSKDLNNLPPRHQPRTN